MPPLSSPDFANQWHHLRVHKVATDDLVPGLFFLTQTKNGVSALELRRQLGIGYNAALRMKHKLMQVMKERDDSHPLFGII
jgi:hypothetical protein